MTIRDELIRLCRDVAFASVVVCPSLRDRARRLLTRLEAEDNAIAEGVRRTAQDVRR